MSDRGFLGRIAPGGGRSVLLFAGAVLPAGKAKGKGDADHHTATSQNCDGRGNGREAETSTEGATNISLDNECTSVSQWGAR
jgi:hypothetical protein